MIEITPELLLNIRLLTGVSLKSAKQLANDVLSESSDYTKDTFFERCKYKSVNDLETINIHCPKCHSFYEKKDVLKYFSYYDDRKASAFDCVICIQKEIDEKTSQLDADLNEQMDYFDRCEKCTKFEKCKDCNFPFCSQCNKIKGMNKVDHSEICEKCTNFSYHANFSGIKYLNEEIEKLNERLQRRKESILHTPCLD